jgi:hypothetical protein
MCVYIDNFDPYYSVDCNMVVVVNDDLDDSIDYE